MRMIINNNKNIPKNSDIKNAENELVDKLTSEQREWKLETINVAVLILDKLRITYSFDAKTLYIADNENIKATIELSDTNNGLILNSIYLKIQNNIVIELGSIIKLIGG